MQAITYIVAFSAALDAATAALLAYPGDVVPQVVIVGLAVFNAATGAFVAKLMLTPKA